MSTSSTYSASAGLRPLLRVEEKGIEAGVAINELWDDLTVKTAAASSGLKRRESRPGPESRPKNGPLQNRNAR